MNTCATIRVWTGWAPDHHKQLISCLYSPSTFNSLHLKVARQRLQTKNRTDPSCSPPNNTTRAHSIDAADGGAFGAPAAFLTRFFFLPPPSPSSRRALSGRSISAEPLMSFFRKVGGAGWEMTSRVAVCCYRCCCSCCSSLSAEPSMYVLLSVTLEERGDDRPSPCVATAAAAAGSRRRRRVARSVGRACVPVAVTSARGRHLHT